MFVFFEIHIRATPLMLPGMARSSNVRGYFYTLSQMFIQFFHYGCFRQYRLGSGPGTRRHRPLFVVPAAVRGSDGVAVRRRDGQGSQLALQRWHGVLLPRPHGNRCRIKQGSSARTQASWATNGTGI